MRVNNELGNLVRLGDYIELSELTNSNLTYGFDDVRGCSNNKEIQPTKADISNRSFDRFLIVQPNEFVFNRRTTRMGERLGLGYNNSERTFIFTEDYVCFRVKDQAELLSDFLYIFFLRPEFDRYVRYDSWGSATEFFNWDAMCDVKIILPSVELQQKAIDTYNGLKALAEQNEALIKPLTEACQAYIVDCKKKYPEVELGKYIEEVVLKLGGTNHINISGINLEQGFIPTVADMNGIDKSKYKMVPSECFACNLMHIGRDVKIPLAYNNSNEAIAVSPAYYVFKVRENKKKNILESYLEILLTRSEFGRLAWFHTDSSIRGNLLTSELNDILIPVPPPEVQEAIVNIYNCTKEAKNIANEARKKIQTLCPALIQRAINR